MSVHRTTKLELRCTPDEKAKWQAEADAVGTSVSALVRNRMGEASNTPRPAVDLHAAELQPLRGWLDLCDSSGLPDPELLAQRAEWSGYADTHGIALDDLLARVFVDANSELLV